MGKWTQQEIFDVVATHLLAQGAKSVGWTGECLYRGPKGLKCAIGVLISDELYSPEIEGASISCLRFDVYLPFINRDKFPFLEKLQRVHDKCPVEDWRDELAKVAKKYALKMP